MNNLVRVQSIDRAVAILECFSGNRRELKLSEIAYMLDLNKSTVHGILNSLKYHRFIDQDEITKKYRLGIRFIEYGELVINSMDVPDIAYPIIEDICERIEETVHVAMLDGFDVVYVEKKECNKSIKTSTKIGARIPAYITADGKIILSYLDDDKLNEYVPEKIKKLTPNTITDRNKLLKVLHEMKNKGYATDNEEVVQGISCVAAPIIEHTGRVRFSLSITGPTFRMTKDKMKEYVNIISEAAKEISFRIGYRG
ncbi:MAG TPA: IclR family transcriptional regulator [Clostridiales bacterium]|nr:IclR family transcriptional regulator [Clostridiales bacterium]